MANVVSFFTWLSSSQNLMSPDLVHKLAQTSSTQTFNSKGLILLDLVSRATLCQKGPLILDSSRTISSLLKTSGPASPLWLLVAPLPPPDNLIIRCSLLIISAQILSHANVKLLKILSMKDQFGSSHVMVTVKVLLVTLLATLAMKNWGWLRMMMLGVGWACSPLSTGISQEWS